MADNKTLQIILDLKDNASKQLKDKNGLLGQLSGLESSFKKVQKTSLVALTAIAGATTYAVSQFAKFEQAEIAFESMLGSATEAKNMIKELASFSAKTPFQFEDIVQATRTLISFGASADEAVESLQFLGDISAGAQIPLADLSSIFGKVMTKGKAMTEELLQMAERGIPIIDALAKEFDVTKDAVFKMAEEGELSFDRVKNALQSLTEDGAIFSNQMIKQSQTISGQWSTLKDNMTLLLAEIGSQFEGTSKKLISNITKIIGGVKEWIEQNPLLTKLIIVLSTAISALLFLMSTLVLLLPRIYEGIVLVRAGLVKLNTSLFTSIGYWGLIITAMTTVAFLIEGRLSSSYRTLSSQMEKVISAQDANIKSILEMKNGTDKYTTSIDALKGEIMGLEKEMVTIGENVAKINKQITDAVAESNKRQAQIKMSTAELFIEQEQKVADITQEIEDKKSELKEMKKNEDSTRARNKASDEIRILEDQLEQEKSALENSALLRQGLEQEFTEVKRRASLTEFERKLEDLANESKLEKIRLSEKLTNLAIEKEAVVKQQEEISNVIIAKKEQIQSQEEQRVKAEIKNYYESARVFIQSERAKAEARGESTKAFEKQLERLNKLEEESLETLTKTNQEQSKLTAKDNARQIQSDVGTNSSITKDSGWLRNIGTLISKITGVEDVSLLERARQSVNDAIISPEGNIITTHPDDYLIATKNPHSLAGGGQSIVITGNTLLSEDVAERIGDMIMQKLKLNTSM